jgi:glycosyltransferase involved in cell wall biosynthesis
LKYGLEVPALIKSLTALVDANETDLLYVNGPRLVPPAAWIAWRRCIPLVFHCHNRLLQYSAITLTGVALELASAYVIACCQYAVDPLREYVAPDRLHIAYNGVSELVTGRLRSARRMRRIGVVGRVEEEKGQLQFVQAARLIHQEIPECRFSVIGIPMFSGNDYYRKVVASSGGLPIDFVDWQSDTAKIYSGLDLLVVPSTAVEATTRVILEAYSAGVPVVAFRAGGIPEILADEQTGFLAQAATVEALAERVLSVLRMDKETLEAVVRRARRTWRDRFTLEAYRSSVCNVLAQAMQPIFQSSYDELRVTEGVATD